MPPYYSNFELGTEIYNGDVRDVCRSLPAASVHCVCTSPPYWGLRDYSIDPTVWGGDSGCLHDFVETVAPGGGGTDKSFRRDKQGGRKRGGTQPGFCIHCEAWKGCLGNEPTPELFVRNMVLVFREVGRVLRDDGTLWLNIGDSYGRNSSKGTYIADSSDVIAQQVTTAKRISI